MYTINETENEIILESSIRNNRLTVVPGSGANVRELVLDGDSVIDGCLTAEETAENFWCKSLVMLPFVNRIKDGKYRFKEREYRLPVNEPGDRHAIHGFWAHRPMTANRKKTGKENAALSLVYDYKGDYPGFPFPFFTEIFFYLGPGFEMRIRVENTGQTAMPVGCGWHPYFRLGREPVDRLELKLPSAVALELDKRKIPTGKTVKLDEFATGEIIGNADLDTAFVLESTPGRAVTELYDRTMRKGLRIWQETGVNKYNYLQVYTPYTRHSIAVEPVTSAADAFNNGLGLIELEPGHAINVALGVEKF